MTDDLWVRGTAWLSGVLYVVSLTGMIGLRHSAKVRAITVRLFWTSSWLVFLIHVALAFHLVHHWSHHHAWDHTQRLSGYGDGIYLNYFVILVWTFDVVWWWVWPTPYLSRSRWITYVIHGFLFFMWFNAAVVFPLVKVLAHH